MTQRDELKRGISKWSKKKSIEKFWRLFFTKVVLNNIIAGRHNTGTAYIVYASVAVELGLGSLYSLSDVPQGIEATIAEEEANEESKGTSTKTED